MSQSDSGSDVQMLGGSEDMDFDFAHDDEVLEATGAKDRVEEDAKEDRDTGDSGMAGMFADNQSRASHHTNATNFSFAANFLRETDMTEEERWIEAWVKKVRDKLKVPTDCAFPPELFDSLKAAFQLEKTDPKGRDAAWKEIDGLEDKIRAVMQDKVVDKQNKLKKATRREVVLAFLTEIAGMYIVSLPSMFGLN